ncbi:type II toxin-antitoxin system RelE/ParE family toxin [Bacillus sp. FJAT-29790]|uniref:type II toxin-antitoxin system RelE/ParE family toxin n=1 Tax=Bacillus sp. FJAT-29790 TaxID=1895002 RepID=UPI001C24D5E6|nr:type II toxin-antitoxin system RelE/ParE family toxin [Bacillus sp. FJAT-29790]MBU8879003.1 type II toxin-antitoxin system RelE/ParE family toxin [Bacillus sp. FJAT-29790]
MKRSYYFLYIVLIWWALLLIPRNGASPYANNHINDDLNDIFEYILLDNPSAAASMLDKIMSSLRQLEGFPNSGVKVNESSIKNYHFRMLIIEPYAAFYRIIENKVHVYRILHGSRDYINVLKNNK